MNNVEMEEVLKMGADIEIFYGGHPWRAVVPTMMDVVDQVFEIKNPVVSAVEDAL